MNEFVHLFGSQRHLHGIATCVTQPPASSRWVVFINAGAVHKTGPFDLHVHLARGLAECGWNSLRFDLSGQGDSLEPMSEKPRSERLIEDISEAVDFLVSSYAAETIVLAGLCTGADNAHKAAVQDDRIKGVVTLDGYAYPSARFYWNRYAPVLFNPRRLLHAVTGRLAPHAGANGGDVSEDDVDTVYYWSLPPQQQFEQEMTQLHARQVKCLHVFTGGVRESFNYPQQHEDAFRGSAFLEAIETHHLPASSHTFLLHNDRLKLQKIMQIWLESCF